MLPHTCDKIIILEQLNFQQNQPDSVAMVLRREGRIWPGGAVWRRINCNAPDKLEVVMHVSSSDSHIIYYKFKYFLCLLSTNLMFTGDMNTNGNLS